MPQLIAGNWNMHGLTADAVALAKGVVAGAAGLPCELLVCPPFVHLAAVAQVLAGSPVALGGQDCHQAKQGAHTGDISAPMVRDAGATWVILGHSERRQNHGETDELVREKVLAATEAGLTPIVCVGEVLAEREAGKTNEVLIRQTCDCLAGITTGIDASEASPIVIAYEPVWAIGTGKTATPQMASEAHALIRGEVAKLLGKDVANAMRILYGGSVKPDSATALMNEPDIDGALVGGASLDPQSFAKIVNY